MWTIRTPQKIHEPCPLCGVHRGKHQPYFEKGQPGRICMDCRATWPMIVETMEISPPKA